MKFMLTLLIIITSNSVLALPPPWYKSMHRMEEIFANKKIQKEIFSRLDFMSLSHIGQESYLIEMAKCMIPIDFVPPKVGLLEKIKKKFKELKDGPVIGGYSKLVPKFSSKHCKAEMDSLNKLCTISKVLKIPSLSKYIESNGELKKIVFSLMEPILYFGKNCAVSTEKGELTSNGCKND